MPALAQIGIERIGIPRDGRGRGGIDGEGAPALRFAAREGFVSLLRTEHVAWRVTGAAMANALDEIGAPVPKIVMRGIGLERPPRMKSRFQPTSTGRSFRGKGSPFAGAVACAGSRVMRNA
jgi:hypothetical protein